MTTIPLAFLLSQGKRRALLMSSFSMGWDPYRYSGEWNAGVFHGKGSYDHDNGDRYVGQWNKGQRHGHGIYTWVNGDQWIGNFKNDQLWGSKGANTFIKADGTKFIGTWKGKEFWEGQEYNQTDQLVAKYSGGMLVEKWVAGERRFRIEKPPSAHEKWKDQMVREKQQLLAGVGID